MPDNWEDYKDWKKLMESISKPRIEFVDEDDNYIDDEVADLKELFQEYID